MTAMEDRLDLPVSKGAKGKTVTVACGATVAKCLNRPMEKLGVRMVAQTDHLGVTTAAGRARRCPRSRRR